MSDDVKCPKVPHWWGKTGRGWGSFGWLGPSSLSQFYSDTRKLDKARGQKRHLRISKTSSFTNTGLLETKLASITFSQSPQTHKHTRRSKKVIVASNYPKEIGHLLFLATQLAI